MDVGKKTFSSLFFFIWCALWQIIRFFFCHWKISLEKKTRHGVKKTFKEMNHLKCFLLSRCSLSCSAEGQFPSAYGGYEDGKDWGKGEIQR